MGFNTVLLVLNDAQHEIAKDPAGWWQQVERLQTAAQVAPQRFGFGSHGNGFEVVTNHHADRTSVIAVGGNYATVLADLNTGNRAHHTAEGVEYVLRASARRHGFDLRRWRD